jgi:hypothetical protein
MTVINRITSHKEEDKTMYSTLAVLRAISVWSLLDQYIGQSAYLMTKPDLDIRLLASCGSV